MIKEPAVNKIHRAPRAALVCFSIVILAAAFASLMSSCTDSVGIFASLSQEKPIGTLSTKELSSASPACVVRYNVAGTDYFFMSSGFIYQRPLALAKDSWTAISSAQLPADASRCTQIAAADRLYAAWLDNNFAFVGLYASSNAADWTAIAFPSDPSAVRQVTGLFTLNGTVFVAVKQSTNPSGTEIVKFKLYYVSGNDAVECTFDTDADAVFDDDLTYDSANPYVTTSIRSMTWDGTNYWFVSGSSIYRRTTSYEFSKVTETDMPTEKSLTSISWSADLNRILVSTGSGVFKVGETMTGITPGLILARRASDGVWETSAPSVLVSSTTGGYANFTDILTVPDNSGAPVIVASAASSLKYGDGKSQSNKAAATRGYGVLVPDTGSIIGRSARCSSIDYVVSTWPSYEISLMDYAVTGLYYLDGETGSKVLFAGTAGRGLWSIRRSPEGIWEEDWQKE
jgi:hypothetical protein